MERKQEEIDGKEFGEKLFAWKPNFANLGLNRKEISKYRALLTQIQNDDKLKDRWQKLGRWRNISNPHDQIMFFKVQCLLRNSEAQEIRQQFTEQQNIEGFYKYVDQIWFLPYEYFVKYDTCLDQALMDAGYSANNNISRNDDPLAVVEMFTDDADLKIDMENQTVSLPRRCENFNGRQITAGFGMSYDFELVKSDKKYREPVIYLRIDLRKYDKYSKDQIDDIVSKKRKIFAVEKSASIGKSAEMALMLNDLKCLGLKAPDIFKFITWTTKGNRSASFVKEKLAYADKLIKDAPERDFPPKTASKK